MILKKEFNYLQITVPSLTFSKEAYFEAHQAEAHQAAALLRYTA